jgi:peptidyl-prolyl cis-trans isomerase SurA
MTEHFRPVLPGLVLALGMALAVLPAAAQLQMRGTAPAQQVVIRAPAYAGDYIIAVVNSDLVTAAELEQRVQRLRAAAGQRQLSPEQLREQALESLVEERVLLTYARDSGMRVDDAEVDRAVQSVAAQNQLTLPQLRERLRADGIEYSRFRANLRDQILLERVRER